MHGLGDDQEDRIMRKRDLRQEYFRALYDQEEDNG